MSGAFEAAGVAALSVFGVPPDQGLAAALVSHDMGIRSPA